MSGFIERGTITRVQGRKVYVEVPKLGLGVQFGPCDVAWQSEFTEVVDPDGPFQQDSPHRHALPKLKVGQKVLVAPVHGIPDDVVVLGIIG